MTEVYFSRTGKVFHLNEECRYTPNRTQAYQMPDFRFEAAMNRNRRVWVPRANRRLKSCKICGEYFNTPNIQG